ncbi:molecular chaperone [Escherichia coli]|nr:molecular chaperone [Escherichia coli]
MCKNSGDNTSYLIQSWVDDSKTGKKRAEDFVITPPPLYVANA